MDTVVIKPYFRVLSFSALTTTTTPHYSTCFCLSRFKLTPSSFNNKPKRTSPIALSHKTPINPINPKPPKRSSYSKPITLFIGCVKFLAECSSITRWVSVDFDSTDTHLDGDYVRNGGLGMAILSVKSSAEGRISPFLATLAANPTFVSGFFAWAIAQSAKVVLNFFVERRWDLRIMFTSGGMPSSHSALCTALTTSVAICHGVADSLFPVCLGFSLIVMYDAIGVRRHAGMQAEVLNLIVEDLFQGHPISKRKLKELLGHTPSQVLAGALLGIVVACFCCKGCLVAP